MALGNIQFKMTDVSINLNGGQIILSCNATKWIEDDAGQNQTVGQFGASVSYTPAAFAAKTGLQMKNDLIAALQAQFAALAGKTIQ